MFETRGLQPPRVCETDQEDSRRSLVSAGVGLDLMREDIAREVERAGELVIWPGHIAHTTLWLIYLTARESESPISALRSVMRLLWPAPG